MSEDLDSFFAKRKTKASKKKAIKIEDVGQSLENNLKFHQDEDEVPITTKRSTNTDFPISQEEDSEWIQYNSKPAIPLETVGVFNYNEQVEQEHIAEERLQQAERAKTWKKAESEPVKETTPVPTPVPVQEPPKIQPTSTPAPYRPPNTRSLGQPALTRRPVHKLDIESEELFPSLEKADQIEKIEKEKEKSRVEEPQSKPTPKAPQDVRLQNAWAPKEPTPEVATVLETKTIVIQQPVAEPKPNVYQPPAGRVIVERSQDEQSTNKPYVPRVIRGEDSADAPRPQINRPEVAGRGTGMFNARGEEILMPEKPATVVSQNSWRRDNTETHQEQSVGAPARNQQPEQTNWRLAQPDRHQQDSRPHQQEQRHQDSRPHQQDSRPHQPIDNPTPNNWRNNTDRQPAPRRDHGRDQARDHGYDRHSHNEQADKWRSGPRREFQPTHDRPNQQQTRQSHQIEESQQGKEVEHVNEVSELASTEQNWRSQVDGGDEAEFGDDWHVAGGKQRRPTGGSRANDNPQSGPRRNPTQGQKTHYVPPNRR